MSYGSKTGHNVRMGKCLSIDYYRQYIIISAMQRMYMTKDICVHSRLDKWNRVPPISILKITEFVLCSQWHRHCLKVMACS